MKIKINEMTDEQFKDHWDDKEYEWKMYPRSYSAGYQRTLLQEVARRELYDLVSRETLIAGEYIKSCIFCECDILAAEICDECANKYCDNYEAASNSRKYYDDHPAYS